MVVGYKRWIDVHLVVVGTKVMISTVCCSAFADLGRTKKGIFTPDFKKMCVELEGGRKRGSVCKYYYSHCDLVCEIV